MPRYIMILKWLIAAGILLLLSVMGIECINVYMTQPFTRELAAEMLMPIGAVCIPGAAVVLAVSIVRKRYAVKEDVPQMSPDNRLRLMKARIEVLPEAVLKEEKRRRKLLAVVYGAASLCAMTGGNYFLDGDHFTSWELETVMGNMLIHVLPWLAAALILAYAGLVLRDVSINRETELLKSAPAGKLEISAAAECRAHAKFAPAVLLVVAVVLIVAGIFNGGARDVLVKAINICTECIGLG